MLTSAPADMLDSGWVQVKGWQNLRLVGASPFGDGRLERPEQAVTGTGIR
jgi:hypothetical protein